MILTGDMDALQLVSPQDARPDLAPRLLRHRPVRRGCRPRAVRLRSARHPGLQGAARRHLGQHPRRARHRRQDGLEAGRPVRHRREPVRAPGRRAGQAARARSSRSTTRSRWRRSWRPSSGDVPGIELDLDRAQLGDFDRQRVVGLFHELGFRRMLDDIARSMDHGTADGAGASGQLAMFAEAAAEDAAGSDDSRPAAQPATAAGRRRHHPRPRRAGRRDRAAQGGADASPSTSRRPASQPMRADIVGIGLATGPDAAWYIPVGHTGEEPIQQLDWPTVRDRLAPILGDAKIEKWAHNAKFHQIVLARHGVETEGLAFDSMIAAYLLESNQRAFALRDLAWTQAPDRDAGRQHPARDRALGHDDGPPLDREGRRVRPQRGRDPLPAGPDARQRPEGRRPGAAVPRGRAAAGPGPGRRWRRTASRSTCRTSRASARRWPTGSPRSRRRRTPRSATSSASNSPQKLGDVLYKELKLPQAKRTRTGQASTGAEVLEELKGVHPVIELVLEHRHLTEAEVDLRRRAAADGQPRDGPGPRLVQPDRRRDRPPLQHRPEPPEHPDPDRPRQAGAAGVHHRLAGDLPAERRLQPDRAAGAGPLHRRTRRWWRRSRRARTSTPRPPPR